MKKSLIILLIFLSGLMVPGCIETRTSNGSQAEVATNSPGDPNVVISLFGVALPPITYTSREESTRVRHLEEARKNYDSAPDSVENIIWYGRQLGYLGRYGEAIALYTEGLAKKPDSYHLLRHRGHRYITIRQFDKAIEDLQKAAFYSRRFDNAPEPNGLKLGKPITNDKFNIWYHLGIAFYLKGNYDKAISSFKKCLNYCDNDELTIATVDWFYMTYRKLGNVKAAELLLEKVHSRMKVVENKHYLDRIMLYKGIYNPNVLLEEAEEDTPPDLAYGIANWYLYNGQVNIARDVFEQILRSDQWDSFGYIAAEVELVNLRNL